MYYKYLFGPVPSRRLGISLGVDMVPFKFCSMNCVYCEIGKTSDLTVERKEYIPFKEVAAELHDYLQGEPHLDYITFSGAGEPLLNSKIGAITDLIKNDYPQYKIALITNSSLLADPEVRAEIRQIDLILPSLDAVSQEIFDKINRPHESLSTSDIIDGLIAFRKESKAEMWLEIFFVPGINDSDQEIELLRDAALKIDPHQVQLNALDRPGTESWVKKESDQMLGEIAKKLQPLPVKVIARNFSLSDFPALDHSIEDKLKSTLKRRPCTAEDLSKMLNMHINQLNKYLNYLTKEGVVTHDQQEAGTFFKVRDEE
jgi:wyosine [tRNA(Phe)-imidazoG37] synthetase (radical SAM superfamily)